MTNPECATSLAQLTDDKAFLPRHIGPTPTQQAEMAQAIGYPSLEALIDATLPEQIRRAAPMNLEGPRSEQQVLEYLQHYADQNVVKRSVIGMGYHDTFTPAVIQRNVLENPGWYTAYTPYQPEISQGRLEVLLTFQQMVMDLTGMDLANASLLDEGTAAAEAMTLVQRVNKKNRSKRFVVAGDCHPQTIALLRSRAEPLGLMVDVANPDELLDPGEAFGLLVQYPGTYGNVVDLKAITEAGHARNTLVVAASDLLALTLLESPGAQGVDVVVGNTQRFGVPMGFGGPHAAFFATREAYKRSTPGRIIGVSVDRHGNSALRMAMQTREQHIRREKATSNICTAQALLAIMAALYAMYHGPRGLRRIGERVHGLTSLLRQALADAGITVRNEHWFDTLTVEVGEAQSTLIEAALDSGFNLRVVGHDAVGIALDETTTFSEVAQLATLLGADIPPSAVDEQLAPSGIPEALRREVDYLQHPLFNDFHSETAMLRYLKRLENKDISLTRAMIPLGSCTMKLNATTEMLPVTWPEFARLHPFAPMDQCRGYQALFKELEAWLCECTGYDAMSLQPNAGSQGEYAGLLAIRRYHQARGDHQRDICLIPSSAHGTNPASAVMAGMQVVIVACDTQGNVDMSDLRDKVTQHSERLAAIMVTYPSTHGVFEESIVDLCALIHDHGGQVYVDGANLNALIGLAAPGHFGADVSHLNLHKTFCIPHGGGGPGMGPIGVRGHLADYLPNSTVAPIPGLPAENDTVSSAPYGSASILPISWTYIALMGAEGLTRASEVAILNANYVAHRLQRHFDILYTGSAGTVAHECIVDIRPLKAATGISEEDVAKRLVDFGFHAPTMSFPVAGTLMIEPTESESLAELDRFCDAMIAIREEIRRVESGALDAEDNPLKNAPHTLSLVTSDNWPHSYTRQQAAYPVASLRQDKYWAPVSRVDNVYGDRNLFCACPGMEVWQEESATE
ncbi:glycine dehydrogenase [Luminiphilus syltensis NOR5-1B]|uniref:Glycine dehydrogenase (decarboxylating) n=1 Tax=Luminiphilus syltensis NOR5-1B TaxID=565045 RepID=B8KY77_9GAMM|nr:aminomethyl-transferring glycine dehydrogenase [Luminiphilus syltensis]EED35322.1 glycine dehydrogenase [Luminiphilus syltensis NOR5-1B]